MPVVSLEVDGRQTPRHLHHRTESLAFEGTYVGVEETQDELKVRLLAGNERHPGG